MRRVSILLMVSLVATLLASSVFAVDPPKPPTVPPTPAPTVIEGSITTITQTTPTSGTITVAPPSPIAGAPTKLPVTFAVNEKTTIVKDGKPVTLAALVVGDGCRAMVVKTADGTLVAQIVYATSVAPPVKAAMGTICDKSLWNAKRTFKLALPAVGMGPTRLMWFLVDTSTKITVDGKPATYDQIANGQVAEVRYSEPPPTMNPVEVPIPAISVAAQNPPPPPVVRAVGKLVAMDPAAGTISVMPRLATTAVPSPAPAPIVLKVTDATVINKFGPATVDALVLGDSVEVSFRPKSDAATIPPIALTVTVQPEAFTGIVDKVTLDSTVGIGTIWITQRLATGAAIAPVPFKVVVATKIARNGAPARLSQIAKGDMVNLQYFQFKDAKVAAFIDARSPVAR